MMGGLLIAGMILGAASGTTPAAAPAAQAPQADERLVCRRDNTVGSRLGTRICLTRAQWRERETAERGRTRDIVDQSERENRADPWHGDTPR
jgi:hypothetical protein